MGGMEMMLKSMGLDPEDLKAKATQAQQSLVAMVETIRRIETRLAAIEQKLDEQSAAIAALPDVIAVE